MLEINDDTILEKQSEDALEQDKEEQLEEKSIEKIEVIKEIKEVEKSKKVEEIDVTFLREKGLSENLVKTFVDAGVTDEHVRLLENCIDIFSFINQNCNFL